MKKVEIKSKSAPSEYVLGLGQVGITIDFGPTRKITSDPEYERWGTPHIKRKIYGKFALLSRH